MRRQASIAPEAGTSRPSVPAPVTRGFRSGSRWVSRLCLVLLGVATAVVGCGLTLDLLGGTGPAVWAGTDDAAIVFDADLDGIPDVAENEFTGLDPYRFDTDGDGYGDGFELAVGSDPTDFYDRPGESSGVRILVAPDGEDVYIIFVVASESRFKASTDRKALFVGYGPQGVSAATALFLGDTEDSCFRLLESIAGNVRSWTLKVKRADFHRWSIGVGMREGPFTYCDGLFVHRRANDCIYQTRFASEPYSQSRAEPTESETSRSENPGEGFKECEQLSYSSAGSPLRHILSESCETRENYICPSDCGALSGQTIIDLKKVWLY